MSKKLALRLAVIPAAAMATGAAFAQSSGGIDVSAVTTNIGAQAAPVAAIGAAVLLLVVGIKAFHWVRRALS